MPKNNDIVGQAIADRAVTNPGSIFRGAAHGVAAYSQTGRALRSATSVSKAAGGVARGVAKRAGPLMVAGAAIDAANLAVNPHARQAAHDDVEKNAKLNPVVRSAKAFLDPVTTGYGIASQVKELMNSTRDAKKSEANYQAELQKRKARKQSGALAQQSKFRSPPMQ